MIIFRSIAIIGVLAVSLSSAQAEKRVALVIGNSEYEHASTLPNPGNDARDIAASFERLGFQVTRLDNLSFSGMRRALGDFSRQSLGADMAVIFYAGHGMEVNKQNYLIPTDAKLETDLSMSYEAVPLELVTEAVSGAKGLKLVMLDACRNNPFAASMEVTNPNRSIGRGLARVEPVAGTLVAFAAKEGTVASDGEGENSPYTSALLAHLEQPGLEIQFLFRKVRDKVMSDTSNQQQPFTYGSLPGREIYLTTNQTKPVQPHNDSTGSLELALWNEVKDSGDERLIQEYLDQFPSGVFSAVATAKLASLNKNNIPPSSQDESISLAEILEFNARKVEENLRTGEKRPGYLGARVQTVTDDIANGLSLVEPMGVMIVSVHADGPAHRAGLKSSDVILSMNGVKYSDVGAFVKSLTELPPGGKALYQVWRKSEEMPIVVSLGAASADKIYQRGRAAYTGKRFGDAAEAFLTAADLGHAKAQFQLGRLFRLGQGVNKDDREALTWYLKAAAQGHVSAQYNSGVFYQRGLGTSVDNFEAAKWYQKAAEQGHESAKFNLGLAYGYGRGLEKDEIKAAQLMEEMAENGHAGAQFQLALYYMSGTGGKPKDVKKAAELVSLSIKSNYSHALERVQSHPKSFTQSFRMELQRILKNAGAYNGAIDGSFGPATQAAIEKYAGKS